MDTDTDSLRGTIGRHATWAALLRRAHILFSPELFIIGGRSRADPDSHGDAALLAHGCRASHESCVFCWRPGVAVTMNPTTRFEATNLDSYDDATLGNDPP